jgi:hypothetical protein
LNKKKIAAASKRKTSYATQASPKNFEALYAWHDSPQNVKSKTKLPNLTPKVSLRKLK